MLEYTSENFKIHFVIFCGGHYVNDNDTFLYDKFHIAISSFNPPLSLGLEPTASVNKIKILWLRNSSGSWIVGYLPNSICTQALFLSEEATTLKIYYLFFQNHLYIL